MVIFYAVLVQEKYQFYYLYFIGDHIYKFVFLKYFI